MSSEDVALNRHQDTSNGLRAVRQIAKRLNLDGVFGPLYDLFEVSDKYKTAVEVTSGNRLVFFFFLGELTLNRTILISVCQLVPRCCG